MRTGSTVMLILMIRKAGFGQREVLVGWQLSMLRWEEFVPRRANIGLIAVVWIRGEGV